MDVVFDNLDVFVDGFRTTISLTLLSAVGALLLVAWVPLRVRPGIGTLTNTVIRK